MKYNLEVKLGDYFICVIEETDLLCRECKKHFTIDDNSIIFGIDKDKNLFRNEGELFCKNCFGINSLDINIEKNYSFDAQKLVDDNKIDKKFKNLEIFRAEWKAKN